MNVPSSASMMLGYEYTEYSARFIDFVYLSGPPNHSVNGVWIAPGISNTHAKPNVRKQILSTSIMRTAVGAIMYVSGTI